MRKIFTLLFCLSLLSVSLAQTQKHLTKSFNLQGHTALVIDLNGIVDVKEWDNSYVQVLTKIEVVNFGENYLKKLVSVGRYDLEGFDKGDGFVISSPEKFSRAVYINGRQLEEVISFVVNVPRDISIDVKSSASSGL